MKSALPILAALLMLALAAVQPARAQPEGPDIPTAVSELGEGASDEEQTEALRALTEWLGSDFDAARPHALAWSGDEGLPLAFRSSVLRAAMAAAREASNADFVEEAASYYLDLADRLPAGPESSKLHQSYGVLLYSRGRFAEAEPLLRRAIDEGGDRPAGEVANIGSALGVVLAQQGRLDEALAAMLDAYRLYEQTEEGPSADLLRNIGGLSIYLENWEQAVTFSRLALDKVGADNPRASGIYSNLAAAQVEMGRLEEALASLQTGIALSEEIGQPNSAAVSNLGYVLKELGRVEEGLEHFERAAALDREEGDIASLAITLKNVGETLIQLDRRDEADTVLQESLASYREADIKPKRLELYPVLVENLEALGRYPEALAMMREYRALSEEITSAEAQARIAELQTAFDLERKERELAESERERLAGEARVASLEAAQSRQRNLRTLMLTGIAALALILMLLLRLLQLRNRANRLLAEKNAQIDQQHKALGETNARLRRQSVEDELTGLGNRRSIRLLLESELPPALADRQALVMLIDLDRFKGINDEFGHPVGDAVLARFADVLRAVAPSDDRLARWGGEEFLWLVAGADMTKASERCRALSEELGRMAFEADGRRLSITCSIGVAPVHLAADDPQKAFDQAVKIADAALYEAKDSGRNGWAGFEPRSDDPRAFEGSLDIDALVARGALVRRRLDGDLPQRN